MAGPAGERDSTSHRVGAAPDQYRRYRATVADDDVFHTHEQPVWRARSNFIVAVPLPERHHYEQLWARREANDLFEICCIPFFARDMSLGDLVRTRAKDGRTYVVEEVVHASGRWTFRLWLGKSDEDRLGVEAEFLTKGALTEWASDQLLALDASTNDLAQLIADRLAEGERTGRWIYETGRS